VSTDVGTQGQDVALTCERAVQPQQALASATDAPTSRQMTNDALGVGLNSPLA